MPDDAARRIAFLTRELNALGGKHHQTLERLTAVRNEARRSQTAASLIRQFFMAASREAGVEEIGVAFLRIVTSHMNARRAVTVTGAPDDWRVEFSLGGEGAPSSSPPLWPPFAYNGRKDLDDRFVRWATGLIDCPHYLWRYDASQSRGVLLGRETVDHRLYPAFGEEDGFLIDSALMTLGEALRGRQREEEIKRMNQTLEEQVARRTSDLLAAQAELMVANRRLEGLASTDRLTGLANRMRLEEALEREGERFSRYGRPFSVILLDIDHFKKVNDTYGHDAGDRTLVKVASLLSAAARTGDTVGRWGGEEFMLALPESGCEGALAMAEKARVSVERASFEGPGRLTVSLGVATIMAGESLRELTLRADQALYAAKRGGRNRVERAPEGTVGF
ncbi:MAG: GGDEF domain-containing protein [Nitrospinae bacterium]|nr:GGDEF domain-containing protein [Nitrospinota bacterium]